MPFDSARRNQTREKRLCNSNGEFISAGIHVLVEKPLAADAESARDLVARALDRRVVLQVGHIERFSPAVREMKKRVDANMAMLSPDELVKNWMAFGAGAQEQFRKLMEAGIGAATTRK